MKTNHIIRTAVILILTVTFTGCLLPTSSTTVKGRVLDGYGKTVANADVKFGGTGFQTTVQTAADGTFTVTARHRPTQMLYLEVSKKGVGTYSDKFPGFGAPSKPIDVELMATIGEIPTTR